MENSTGGAKVQVELLGSIFGQTADRDEGMEIMAYSWFGAFRPTTVTGYA
jgi:hypothetical protein